MKISISKNTIIVLLFCIGCVLNTTAQIEARKLKDLGPQIASDVVQGSAFLETSKKKEYVFTVVRGEPAHLLGYDLGSGNLAVNLEIKGVRGSWDIVVSTNGLIYIAGDNGHLYSYNSDRNVLEDLGKALPSETVIFDLTAGKNGEIFGGTYPGCRVFSYKPGKGFQDVGKGGIVSGENYVRSVIYSAQTDKVYAGVGAHAHLIEVDPESGAKVEMLDKKYRSEQFVYTMELITAPGGNEQLFCWLTGSTPRKTVVYDLKTRALVTEMGSIDVKSVIKAGKGDSYYYSANYKLFQADFSNQGATPRQVTTTDGVTLASFWSRNNKLYLLNAKGVLVAYDPTSGKRTLNKLSIPQQNVEIQTLREGPDGKIWSAGLLSGGNAAFNAKTQKVETYSGLEQTEGMVSQGKQLYFGVYPKCKIYVYDTERPWSMKDNNPRFVAQVPGQDRPYAGISVDKLNKVYFGTVPGYGELGGALVECNTRTNAIQTFDDVIARQSIVSLAYAADVIIGGSSVFGGLGAAASATEAKLFGWDPASNKKTFELVPVPGAVAITSLLTYKDGKVWGVADGTLFIFDPVKKKVTRQQEIYPIKGKIKHMLQNAYMVEHASGKVFVSANNILYEIDPETLKAKKLLDKVTSLTIDKSGNLYFKRAANLWKYTP